MPNQRILIIDDDVALLQAIQGTFELRLPEVVVETCVSVTPVLERIRTNDYHAILCDMNMPVVNGLELLREMKKVRRWTPILVMTANDSDALIQEAARAGAYDFIKKPVNRDMLVLSIKRALEKHQSRDKRQSKDTILCLEGLSPFVSVESLRNWLSPFGKILCARLVLDNNEKHQSSAYGYVEFATTLEAKQAKASVERASLESPVHVSLLSDVIQHRMF